MLPIKLDYIYLEDFIKIHPELTDEDRAAILALDKNFGSQPVIRDRDTKFKSDDFPYKHVLEESEIRDFLAEYVQNANSGVRNSLFDQKTVEEKFYAYLIDRVDERVIQNVYPVEALPILPGKRLLAADETPPEGFETIAEYNLSLYFEWFETSMMSWESLEDLEDHFSKGPIRVARIVIEEKKSKTEEWDFFRNSLAFGLQQDPLFWQLIDPTNSDPELKLRFQKSLSEALMKTAEGPNYNIRYKWQPRTDGKEYQIKLEKEIYGFRRPSVVDPESLAEPFWATFKRVFANEPVYEKAKPLEAVLPSEFFLDKRAKKDLSQFFSGLETSQVEALSYIRRSDQSLYIPPEDLQTSFLEIFGFTYGDWHIRDGVLYEQDQPVIEVNNLLILNGIGITKIGGTKELAYVKDYIIEPRFDSFYEGQPYWVIPSPIRYPLELVPTSVVPFDRENVDQITEDMAALEASDLVKRYLTLLNKYEVSSATNFPLFEYYLQAGLWQRLENDFPNYSEIFSSIEKEEGIAALAQFYADVFFLQNYNLDTPDRYDQNGFHFEGLYPDEIVIALQNNPHPKLCLAILLINAEQYENLQNELPYIFAQLDWFIPGDFDNVMIGNEILVGGTYLVFGNAWHNWSSSDYRLLGERLVVIPDEELRQDLQTVTTPSLEYTRWGYEYFKENQLEVKNENVPSQVQRQKKQEHEIDPAVLDLDDLLRFAKLESTKRVLSDMQFEQGKVQLETLLAENYEPAVREDIRRILKRVLKRNEVYIVFSKSDLQYELLPEFIFKSYLSYFARHSLAGVAKKNLGNFRKALNAGSLYELNQIVWSAYFKKNPEKASRYFEHCFSLYLNTYSTEAKSIVEQGLEHYMSSPSDQVTRFLKRHQDRIKRDFYGFNLQLTLESRVNLGNELPWLLDDLNENQNKDSGLVYTSRQKFIYLLKTLNMISVQSDGISKASLEKFSTHVDPQILKLFHYVYGKNQDELSFESLKVFWETTKLDASYGFDGANDIKIFILKLMDKVVENGDLTEENFADLEEFYINFFGSYYIDSLNYERTLQPLLDYAEDHNLKCDPRLRMIKFAYATYQGKDITLMDADDFFTRDSDGNLVFPEGANAVVRAIHDQWLLTGCLLYSFYEAFGPFKLPVEEDASHLKTHYQFFQFATGEIESFEIDKDPYWFDNIFDYIQSLFADDNTNQDFLKLLFQRLHDFSGDFEKFDIVFRPDQFLPNTLYVLDYYSQIEYPKSATEKDLSGVVFADISDAKENIIQSYKEFVFILLLFQIYRKLELEYESLNENNLRVPLDRLKPGNVSDPLYRYALCLFWGLNDEPYALDQLQDYYEEKQEFSEHLSGLDEITDMLLDQGTMILRLMRPELFEFENEEQYKYNLESDAVMAMVELGQPKPHAQALQDLWVNANFDLPKREYSDHATAVMGVLTQASTEEPTGLVYSFQLERFGDHSEEAFYQCLQEVIQAMENGVEISVVNISLASRARLDLARVDKNLARDIAKSLRYLEKQKVTVVIAAGNSGHGKNVNFSGLMFNRLAAMDHRVLVVGSASNKKSVKQNHDNEIIETWDYNMLSTSQEWEASYFSGSGTDHYRPDILMLGEDVTIVDSEGKILKANGTSFSSPAAARLIVKMKELNPNLSVEMIQAILKMTARDLPDANAYQEGAGLVDVNVCLYVAYAIDFSREPVEKVAKAAELGVSEQQADLDQLTKWIRRQVWFTDTFRQSYGE